MKKKIWLFILLWLIIASIIITSGCAGEETTTTTTYKSAPIARITVSKNTAKLYEIITFSGENSSDTDGYITAYEWDFGNRVKASGETVTYAYLDRGGEYHAKLKVTDNDGLSSTAVVTIEVIIGIIKMEVTTSTWLESWQTYNIFHSIKQKLEKVGFQVALEESTEYDAMLRVDYIEEKGAPYLGGGYGTVITCNIKLLDKVGHIIYQTVISAKTDSVVINEDLYENAINNFIHDEDFENLGETIATQLWYMIKKHH
jgi:hypothetical protein